MSEPSSDATGGPESAAESGPHPQSPAPGADIDIERVLAKLDTFWEDEEIDFPSWTGQDLTFGQLRLLFLLYRHGPAAIGRIAEWLGVGLPAASGVVDRVERHGLVERRHGRDDRRIVECLLTSQGRHLLDEIAGTRLEAMRRILRVLSHTELAELDRLLEIVIVRTAALGDR